MNIRIKCVCGARLKAPESCMGKSVRCSACGNAVYIPASRTGAIALANQEIQAWIRVVCSCGKIIKSPPEWAGKKGSCPRCGLEHIMPTAEQTNVLGVHEVEQVNDQVEGPKPLVSLAKKIDESSLNKARPAPTPQPRPANDDDDEDADADDIDQFLEGQTLRKSGLLDLTGREEVQIVDGVAPAVWDAKRSQRAKALKAGPEVQKDFYLRTAVSERIGGFRKRIDNILYRSPALTLTVSVILLLLTALFGYRQITSRPQRDHWSSPPANAYFYDLSTGKLFTAVDSEPPPIPAPGQTGAAPQGVRAYVFSCKNCEDGSLFVGYLESYNPQGDAREQYKKFRELLAKVGPSNETADAEDKAEAGRLVAEPDGGSWIRADSVEGQKIIARAAKPCPDRSAPKPCDPPAGK